MLDSLPRRSSSAIQSNDEIQRRLDEQDVQLAQILKTLKANKRIKRRLNEQETKINQLQAQLNEINQLLGTSKKINKSSKLSRIKDASRSFAKYATIAGFGRIWFSNVKPMKYIWFFVILISSIIMLYSLTTKYIDYTAYDVISQTKTHHFKNDTFPAITLCSYFEITITQCIFNSKSCQSEFETFKDLRDGTTEQCYRFNSNGTYNGTGLHMKINFFQYPSKTYIYITDKYVNNFRSQIPTIFKPGSEYDVFFNKLVDIKLPQPYNPCLTMQDESYRQQNCIDSCIYNNLHSKLNCTIPGFYMSPNLQMCSHPENASDIYEAQCLGECELKECKSISYEVALSSDELPNYSTFFASTVFLNFRFSSNYLEISQVPKTTQADMLASLGGMLGVFLGSNLLSIVEILEYLIEITIIILLE